MPDLKKPNDKDKGSRSAFKIIAQMKSLQTTTSNPMITTKQKIRSCAYHFRQCDCSNFCRVVGMFIYNRKKSTVRKHLIMYVSQYFT